MEGIEAVARVNQMTRRVRRRGLAPAPVFPAPSRMAAADAPGRSGCTKAKPKPLYQGGCIAREASAMLMKHRYWPAPESGDRLDVAAARALSVFAVMAFAVGSALTLVNLRYLPEDWFVVCLGALVALACGIAPALINTGRAGFAVRARIMGGAVTLAIVVLALMNGKVPQVSNVILVSIVMTFTLILGARDGAVAALTAAATQAATLVMYVQSGEAPHWTAQLAAGMIASTGFAWAGAAVFRREMAKAMAALAEEKRRAEAADQAKSAFLANMSHEIRTPLNGVLGMAEVLSQSRLDADQRRALSLIRTSGDQLLAMLNDILDLSRIEAGRMDVEREAFPLSSVLEQVAALHAPALEAKAVGFALDIDPGLDADAPRLGDRLRLAQVLGNLLSNAVKFTEHGRVSLSVRPGETDGEVVFAVEDTGCGMSAEQLARVFEPFTQADVSTTRRYGGSGLGLSIVVRLVDLMNGSINAHSTAGAGSRFVVRLALPKAHPVEAAPEPRVRAGVAPEGLRVLVVDDSETNRLVAAGMLRPLSAAVSLAEGGREAVRRVGEARYDLVLMDIRMPDMDGVEVLRAIRAGSRGAHIPVVAMTANAMDHQRRSYEEAGFDAVLAKPLSADALFQVIDAALARTRGAA
jgi:signal transduction histidine kinase/CheY-like chemotaxis protein